MIYPKSPFCPMNEDNAKRVNSNNSDAKNNSGNAARMSDDMNQGGNDKLSREELMNVINGLEFAVTDINLFLDTHPNEAEAL